MPSEKDSQDVKRRLASLRNQAFSRFGSDFVQDPNLVETFNRSINDLERQLLAEASKKPLSSDRGFSQLIGLGPDAATDISDTDVPIEVDDYEEQVADARLYAVSDLYYIYQHEIIGVFKVVQKLKELFEAGTLKLSSGPGAFGLYQYDKRQLLRYTLRDRKAAYRRVLGYGQAPVAPGAVANQEFHQLFSHFTNEVRQYWRDKRISDVIRERANDPSFGSIASVRRAGLDLRNNLKWASYGHVNVLRVEVMQLLKEAFAILNAEDVKKQFGAETAWDVVEEILVRYFKQPQLSTSPRQKMAVSGREIIRWIADQLRPRDDRIDFEGKLEAIAIPAEEWFTSAKMLGLVQEQPGLRSMAWQSPPAVLDTRPGSNRRSITPARPRFPEFEYFG